MNEDDQVFCGVCGENRFSHDECRNTRCDSWGNLISCDHTCTSEEIGAFKTEEDYNSEGFIGILLEMEVHEVMAFHGHQILKAGHGNYHFKGKAYNGPALEVHMCKIMGRTV